MNAIYTRRSIRKFTDESVPVEKVFEFIRAGMNAPSAGNERPWSFIVVDDREKLNATTEVHPYSKMLKEAPVAIVVCGDRSLEKHENYWVQDCAAATENILLEIADQGFGGVWLGVHPKIDVANGIRKIFDIPDAINPFCIIALGHPAEEKPPKNEFLKERIHLNSWK